MMTDAHEAAKVRFFPPGVPLLTVAAGLALGRVWPLSLGLEAQTPSRYWLGGLIVAGAILGIGLPAVLLMRRSGQSPNPWKPSDHMLERGPFRYTRNPMYLQMVVACLGFAVILNNAWILVLTPVCGWALSRLAIAPEEAYLEQQFGDAYRDYKRRVRRWL